MISEIEIRKFRGIRYARLRLGEALTVVMGGNGEPDTYRGVLFARGAIGMEMRRLIQPLPGTGAIAEYGEMGALGVRVVLDYCPNSLAQTVNIGVLFGVCVKNAAHGLRLE